MPFGGQNSERVLILAPLGRDAEVCTRLIKEGGWATLTCISVASLCEELNKGAAFAVVAEEALANGSLLQLVGWIRSQPAWSDFPIIILTRHGDSPDRNTFARRLQDILGNVSFLERPFHPTTLASLARSALRSRRRQYQARELLERYELLARELQHRTKNLLAIIQSIGNASLGEHGEGRETFFARLHALAKAQDLLMEGDGHGALMKVLVDQALESFGGRVIVEGPNIYLKASAAQGFALIMHELATNAAKHGALTSDAGRVAVRWSLEHENTEPIVCFFWQERGGPPASPPQRKGFGTLLLQHAVANLDSPPRFDYTNEGFSYELRAALAVTNPPRDL
jgi:two-component sensor histidine kinase